jgi:anti-sigma regulatory factor (Ser/Thr protein kinase)
MRDRTAPPHPAPGPGSPATATLHASLPRRLESVGVARRLVEGVVDDRLDEDVRHDAGLLVTELVANSVRHAGGTRVGLAATVAGDAVVVEVADEGPGPDVRDGVRPPDPTAEGGRGIVLVSGLAARWGVGHDPARVWFELRAARGTP